MNHNHPTLATWWTMIRAGAELSGQPIPDDSVVLFASVGGGSCLVTAGDLDKLLRDYQKLLGIAYQLWNCPDDAYIVEREYYEVFGEPQGDKP